MSDFFRAILDGSANRSIASLPLTLFLAALPHWYTIYKAESNKVSGGWSNENPRAFVARLNAKAASTGKKLTDLEELILRGQSAQQNAFEWWPVWAASVLFGYLAKIPTEDMNRYTLIYIATRVAYTYLYVSTKSRAGSYLRTAVFQFSLYPSVAIFARAALTLG